MFFVFVQLVSWHGYTLFFGQSYRKIEKQEYNILKYGIIATIIMIDNNYLTTDYLIKIKLVEFSASTILQLAKFMDHITCIEAGEQNALSSGVLTIIY